MSHATLSDECLGSIKSFIVKNAVVLVMDRSRLIKAVFAAVPFEFVGPPLLWRWLLSFHCIYLFSSNQFKQS